jgi:hypothetical protein
MHLDALSAGNPLEKSPGGRAAMTPHRVPESEEGGAPQLHHRSTTEEMAV